jgi:hypothetical protein
MDIKTILIEMATSKTPYDVLDKYFKSENPVVYQDVDIIVNSVHDRLISIFMEYALEPWMNDNDKKEMEKLVLNQVDSNLTGLRHSIVDGINRNYDIDKYIEFMVYTIIAIGKISK